MAVGVAGGLVSLLPVVRCVDNVSFAAEVGGFFERGRKGRQALSNVKATNVISPALALLLSSRCLMY